MKLFRSPILVLGLLSHVAHAATPEDSTQSVKELIKQGSAEYSKQHWEAARAAFLKAWDLKQHYAIAGSLADVEMKLGRYRDAAEHLKYAIENLPFEHADKHAEAEVSLKECRAHLSALRVSVGGGILTLVTLDGQALPYVSMRDELLLEPGPHKLEAKQEGYQTSTREFVAIAGEAREIRLELAPQPSPPSLGSGAAAHQTAATRSASTSDRGTAGHTSPRTWALIGGGTATVVAAGLGTYFTLRYFSLKSDARQLLAQTEAEGSPALVAKHEQCEPGPMRPAACDQLAQTLDNRVTAAKLSNASWITAGVLGAVTITTYLVWPAEKDGPTRQSRVVVVPWLVGARGGALQVDF